MCNWSKLYIVLLKQYVKHCFIYNMICNIYVIVTFKDWGIIFRWLSLNNPQKPSNEESCTKATGCLLPWVVTHSQSKPIALCFWILLKILMLWKNIYLNDIRCIPLHWLKNKQNQLSKTLRYQISWLNVFLTLIV